MNILIPHSWLLEHLETDASPEEIQKIVSLSGPSIERIYQREGESVYDIEVTTNRVDSMSVRGIAREAAVILSQAGKKSSLKKLATPALTSFASKKKMPLAVPEIIDEQKLCQRTICAVLAHADRTPTPEWMARRLRQIEISVHDAVIDITNYITHELGHPCHAFDYDRLMDISQGTIVITEAKPGKKFVTLDNAEYTTVGGEVVFENPNGEIIDLPGIKGTANTSINQSTKNVLFWIESIPAHKIRFASMTHAIRTVAAQLNEKHVDPHLADDVFARGISLFEELTGAAVASKIDDHFPEKKAQNSVQVELAKIEAYLGVEVPLNTIANILEKLECQVVLKGSKSGAGRIVVTPPTFRSDLQIPADIIEEVARIYGYQNIPSKIMDTAIPVIRPTDLNFHFENKIKHFLSTIGWQELYTYSMVSESIALQSGFPLAEHAKITNPLSDDRVYLRRSLLPSLAEVIATQTAIEIPSIFELANVYQPQAGTLPTQVYTLGLLSHHPYREVKGALEALLKQFFILDPVFTPGEATGQFHQQATIWAPDNQTLQSIEVGWIGILKNNLVGIEIEVAKLLRCVKNHPAYQPLPKTSEVIEDLTFTFPPQTQIGSLLKELKSFSPHLRSAELGAVYEQNYTIKLVYHDPSENISADEVTQLRKKLVAQIQKDWHAQLVGTLA